jgi:hypothetical protein
MYVCLYVEWAWQLGAFIPDVNDRENGPSLVCDEYRRIYLSPVITWRRRDRYTECVERI